MVPISCGSEADLVTVRGWIGTTTIGKRARWRESGSKPTIYVKFGVETLFPTDYPVWPGMGPGGLGILLWVPRPDGHALIFPCGPGGRSATPNGP